MKDYSLALYNLKNEKIADLKSSDISYQGQIFDIRLTTNINGWLELAFSVPLTILDTDGQPIDNFRASYIQNEYKVRLVRGTETHEFIIKSVSKKRASSGERTLDVSCQYLPVHRLSKSGFAVAIELTGTAQELLTEVLSSSDWNVGIVDNFWQDDAQTILKLRTLKAERSNIYNMVQDICDLFNCFPVFNASSKTIDLKKEVGLDNGVQIRYGKNLQEIEQLIETDEVVTKLWVEGGDNGESGLTMITNVNPTGENYILNFDYYNQLGILTSQQLTDISNFQSAITAKNGQLNSALNNLSNYNTDIFTKQAELEMKILQRSTKQQLLDEINSKIVVEVDATKLSTLNSTKNGYIADITLLTSEITTLNTELDTLNNQVNALNLDLLLQEKDNIIKNFEIQLGDFIFEGLFQDSNYIDENALYKDALDISKNTSFPKISYTMSIFDLSKFTGYEVESFSKGDTVKIFDETLGLVVTGRIREIQEVLDRPEETTVEIANFVTKFEDLFSKITTASEVIKNRQEIYERASGINADGSLNYDILQKTFDSNKFIIANGTNEDVQFGKNGIIIKDSVNPNRCLKINSGGIFLTDNFDENNPENVDWKVGMSGIGMSAMNIITGLLDTKNLQIWNSSEPRFFWDANGLFAYGTNGAGVLDKNKWIRFNKDGIYFTLDNGTTFESVWNWTGLKIGKRTAKEINDDIDGAVFTSTATKTVVDGMGGRNLVYNSNFANLFRDWTNWGTPPTREVLDVTGQKFKKALHLIMNSANQGVRQTVKVTSGVKYSLSFDAIVKTGTCGIQLAVSGSGQPTLYVAEYGTLTNVYQHFSFKYTVPAGYDTIELQIGTGGSGATNKELYISNIKFEVGDYETIWTPAPEDTELTANNAQVTISNLISELADDNKLTSVEKQTVKKEWEAIIQEKTIFDGQVTKYAVDATNYNTAYNALSTLLTPLFADMTTTSTITATTFRDTFTNYYKEKAVVISLLDDASVGASAIAITDSIKTNPIFEEWIDALPVGYTQMGTIVPTKEESIKRTGSQALRFNVATNVTSGISSTGFIANVGCYDYIAVEIGFLVQSGNILGSKLNLIWNGIASSNNVTINLDTIDNFQVGKWYTLKKVIKLPNATITGFTGYTMELYANDSTNGIAKDIIFDKILMREATSEEIDVGFSVKGQDVKTYVGSKVKVRYIRDYLDGNSVNASNHWVQIQAYSNAQNVALNKSVTTNGYVATGTLALVTNGNTATTNYVGIDKIGNAIPYVQIDLGSVYDNLEYIRVFHYYSGSRTYYKTRTEVSEDGVNWVKLFDSDITGTYKETSDGRKVIVNMDNAVTKNEIISTINQTAETITILASKINLQGAVTVSTLASDMVTKANGWDNTTTNYNARNDRKTAVPANPIVPTDGTGVDHWINKDGSCDVAFKWSYTGTGDNYDIDGFYIYIYQADYVEGGSPTAYNFGTIPADEVLYTVTPEKRAFMLYGVPADKYYTFGIQAYREVDKDIYDAQTDASKKKAPNSLVSAIVKPSLTAENPYLPSSSVAFSGDISGSSKINGVDASLVASNTNKVSNWASVTDTTKIDGGKIYTGTISADKMEVRGQLYDIALNRSCTYSGGTQGYGGMNADKDPYNVGRWQVTATNQYATVDLGSVIPEITIIEFGTWWANDSRYIPLGYKIDYSSDGTVWTNFVTITGNTSIYPYHVGNFQARYIKLTVTAFQVGQTYANIASFRIWSRQGGTLIDGANIKTGTVSASVITSGTMSADRIYGGTIDANNVNIINLTATNVTANSITTGTMLADRISGGTLNINTMTVTGTMTANHISGGTLDFNYITATNLTVSGSMISGYISADRISGGFLNGVNYQTSYDSWYGRMSLSYGSINWLDGNGYTCGYLKWNGSYMDLWGSGLEISCKEVFADYINSDTFTTNYLSIGSMNVTSSTALYLGVGSGNIAVVHAEGNTGAYRPIRASAFDLGSSEKYKTNIREITSSSIDMVKGTKVKKYNLKSDLEHGINEEYIGLIAEEAPECIRTKDGDGISLYAMTSILWKAIQEQQELINQLKADIEKFKVK